MKSHGMIHVVLLIALLKVTVSGSSVTHSRSYRHFVHRNIDSSQMSGTVHNVTVDCGGLNERQLAARHCLGDLQFLAYQGYPWSSPVQHTVLSDDQNVTVKDYLRYDLKFLSRACAIEERSRSCLQEHGIENFCLMTLIQYHTLVPDFQFICNHRQRDENLLHSLRCLSNKHLLVMLYFHIAYRCGDFGILDDVLIRQKRAYFYTLNVSPPTDLPYLPLLYCLPKDVIKTCIRQVIGDFCGTFTADLVQHYLLYTQGWVGQALQSAGIAQDICEHDVGSNYPLNIQRILSPPGKLGFPRLLEMPKPGSALDTDTLWGKAMATHLQSLPGEEMCTPWNVYYTYTACVVSSGGPESSGGARFNILQFAHGIIPINYQGSHCYRLEQFTTCWNLLQEICGPKVRGLEHHATLLVEGCKIQSEMDTAGCHWQDILLPYYIAASFSAVWPIGGQCLNNPMWLENGDYYRNITPYIKDMGTVIFFIQPGVEEISRRCGQRLATHLQSVLDKLRYLLNDVWKYVLLLKQKAPY